MFIAVAINASPSRRQYTHAVTVDSGMVTMQHVTDRYPEFSELARIFGVAKPDLVLLDLEDPTESLRLFKEIQRHFPEVPTIGIGGTPAQQKQMSLAGVVAFLPYPATSSEFVQVLAKAIRAKYGEAIPHLFAFLPAKAGCGASTLSLAVATSLAKGREGRVLCIDSDLRSGVMALMTGLEVAGSTQAALASAYELDQFRWASSIRLSCGVDFLLSSGTAPQPLPFWSHYFALLRFVESRYTSIVVDLPELINGATEEVVLRAESVFVVTTQEIISLKLAERRYRDLLGWGVPEDRIKLLVNRWSKRDTDTSDILRFVGRGVTATFPNDYPLVRSALLNSSFPLPSNTQLGRSVAEFADTLVVRGEGERIPMSGGLFGMFRGIASKP